MSPSNLHHVEDFVARLVEGVVDAAEFLCPPLKKFLSWDFVDDGSIFAVHDEELSPTSKHRPQDRYVDSPSFKETGVFNHHGAAGAA